MIAKLFYFFWIAFAIWRDFQRDPGQHKVAKVIQGFTLIFLLLSYIGSIGFLFKLVSSFSLVKAQYSQSVGVVSGDWHFLIVLAHVGLCLTVLFLSYQLMYRRNNARKLLFCFLPALALTEAFSFYRGWLSSSEWPGLPHIVIYLFGLLLSGSLAACFIVLYKTDFMLAFFTDTTTKKSLSAQAVSNSIAD